MSRLYRVVSLCLLSFALSACGSSRLGSPASPPAPSEHLKLVATCPASRHATGEDLYVLHGLWSDEDAMATLVQTVISLNIYRRVYTIGYHDDQSIQVTGRELSAVIQANSPVSCDLVGHSLGGLVIRWALEREGLGPRVRKAWLLGTPNLGSTLAQWTAGGALDDLKPGSETLHLLNDGPRLTGVKYDYLTIAGNLVVAGRPTQSDGVVAVNVANWSGLGIHARSLTRSTVNCSHFGLKNSPAALNQLVAMMRVQAAKP
jgi:pimeloyl-ACP methyl ester carboxylesterase